MVRDKDAEPIDRVKELVYVYLPAYVLVFPIDSIDSVGSSAVVYFDPSPAAVGPAPACPASLLAYPLVPTFGT